MSVDVEHFRGRLLEERARVETSLGNLRREDAEPVDDMVGNLAPSSSDQHLADAATETHDRELDEGIAENEQDILRQIDDALARIDAGTYGMCVRGDKEIGAERLEAVPWTPFCIDHAREEER